MNMVEFRKIQIVDIPNDIKNKKLIFVEFFTAEKDSIFFNFHINPFVFYKINKNFFQKNIISFKNMEQFYLKEGEKITKDKEKRFSKLLTEKKIVIYPKWKFHYESFRKRWYLWFSNEIFVFDENGNIIFSFLIDIDPLTCEITNFMIDKNFKCWISVSDIKTPHLEKIFILNEEYKLERMLNIECISLYCKKINNFSYFYLTFRKLIGIPGKKEEVYFVQFNPLIIYKIRKYKEISFLNISKKDKPIKILPFLSSEQKVGETLYIKGINIIECGNFWEKKNLICLFRSYSLISKSHLIFVHPSFKYSIFKELQKQQEKKIGTRVKCSIDKNGYLYSFDSFHFTITLFKMESCLKYTRMVYEK